MGRKVSSQEGLRMQFSNLGQGLIKHAACQAAPLEILSHGPGGLETWVFSPRGSCCWESPACVLGHPGFPTIQAAEAGPSVVSGLGDSHRDNRPLGASHVCGHPGPQESLGPGLALERGATQSHNTASFCITVSQT